jgi:uncharacterized protein
MWRQSQKLPAIPRSSFNHGRQLGAPAVSSSLSSWPGRGHELIRSDSLADNSGLIRPKVIVEGYRKTGFDLINTLKRSSVDVEQYQRDQSGSIHMNGSVLVFPTASFFWNVKEPADITLESLLPVVMHRPVMEYLFVGCNTKEDGETVTRTTGTIARKDKERIKLVFYKKYGMVVEFVDLFNAIGTFNLLNAEDRLVAVALLMDPFINEEI